MGCGPAPLTPANRASGVSRLPGALPSILVGVRYALGLMWLTLIVAETIALAEMQALVEQTWRAAGFTAVLVTHDVEEAVTLADRVVAIDHGRIALTTTISLPRPRRRDSPPFAALAERILAQVLKASR
jgi:sulfonate transport system ATP-binding protein